MAMTYEPNDDLARWKELHDAFPNLTEQETAEHNALRAKLHIHNPYES